MKVGDIEHRPDGDYKLASLEKQGDKWLRIWIKQELRVGEGMAGLAQGSEGVFGMVADSVGKVASDGASPLCPSCNSSNIWEVIRDGNYSARQLADRHYSRKTKGAFLFCGPGEHIVLMNPRKTALFVWRKSKFRKDGRLGVECTIFRNESAALSSYLIVEALKIGRRKWANERFFTYVDPSKIKSTDPGHCFKRAGWRVVSTNKSGKLILLEAPA